MILLTASGMARGAEWKVTERDAGTQAGVANAVRHATETVTEGSTGKTVRLDLLTWTPGTVRLAVVDNPGKRLSLEDAMRQRGALAGVNGGYFQPDDAPLGLVVSGGRVVHGLERSPLITGLVATDRAGHALLPRVPELAKRLPHPAEALQAGPFLVDTGRAVPGLNGKREAARTVVVAAGAEVSGIVLASEVTLLNMGEILATPGVLDGGEQRITRALNLDGGTSSAMWVDAGAGGKDFYKPEWKPVRDFLAVVREQKR